MATNMTGGALPSTGREIWRALRGAKINGWTLTAALQSGASVRVARGRAPMRDAMVRLLFASRAGAPKPLTLAQRLAAFVAARYTAEIARRGGETVIAEESREIGLSLLSRAHGYVLLGCDGWRYYGSRSKPRKASLRYLCGRDDNGRWAVRVPGTVDSIRDALAALEPADVVRARSKGLGVLRQGDIYAVEAKHAGVSGDDLRGTRHRYDEARRVLIHEADDAHGALAIPAGWRGVRFVRQHGLGMGRLNRGSFGRDMVD